MSIAFGGVAVSILTSKTKLEIGLDRAWSRFRCRCAEIETETALAKAAARPPVTEAMKCAGKVLDGVALGDAARKAMAEIDALLVYNQAIGDALDQLTEDLAEARLVGVADLIGWTSL